MIDQLTVFIENRPGRLQSLCETLGDADVNMRALMVADTTEFGVVRIVCDAPARARDLLRAQGYSATLTGVVAIEVSNEPGGLAKALAVVDGLGVNVEYAYCFLEPTTSAAVDVLKVSSDQGEKAETAFRAAGIRVLSGADVYPTETD